MHFSQTSISIVLLTSLDVERQMVLRNIRNEEGVRKWMYTDHLIGVNEHLAWLAGLKQDNSQHVFAILGEFGAPLGVVSVSSIDFKNRKADWAYYLTESARGGLGAAIEYSFLNFAFDVLELEKLNCEVISGNNAVVKMHKKFLFSEEGLRKSNVIKSGLRNDVFLLGLQKTEWINGRSSVYDRYSEIIDKFLISFDFERPAPDVTPIDLIQSARAKNNLNWMSILRLALEKSPEVAPKIVGDIRRLDKEISALTDKLLDEMPMND